MATPPSASRKSYMLGALIVLAILAVVVIAKLGGFGGLRGALSSITFGTDNFLYGPLASAESAPLPAGNHGIFTCPASLQANEVWFGPSNFSSVSGLKIYEYTQTFSQEKDPVNPVWPGERYGFGGSATPGLTTFKPNRTYYVQASQQFDFRCSGPAPVSSSSSSSVPPVSSSSVSSSSSVAPIQADVSVTTLGVPSSVTPGQSFTMSYQMSNAGPGSPAGILLSFMPSGMFTFTNSDGCTQQGASYQCGPFNLASGNTTNRVVNLTVSASAPCGSLQNILGGVSLAAGTDPVSSNDTVNNFISIACPSSSSSSSLEAGLIGYWPLDEGTGTVSQDATTQDHDVALVNGASWGAPLVGAGSSITLAANGDGTSQFVNIGNWPLFNFQNDRDFSLSVVVRPSVVPTEDGILVGRIENRSFAFPGWLMTYTTDQRFGFKMVPSSGFGGPPIALEVKTSTTFAPNMTHHVVVSYNGRDDVTGTLSAEGGTSAAVKIYVDGTEYSVAQGNLTVVLDNLRSPAGVSSIVNNGETQIGMGDGSIAPFLGQIDDVKIYDRVIVPTN